MNEHTITAEASGQPLDQPLKVSKAKCRKQAVDHAVRGSKDITGVVVCCGNGVIQNIATDEELKKAHEEVRRQQAQNR
jgi:hypothetical protein